MSDVGGKAQKGSCTDGNQMLTHKPIGPPILKTDGLFR